MAALVCCSPGCLTDLQRAWSMCLWLRSLIFLSWYKLPNGQGERWRNGQPEMDNHMAEMKMAFGATRVWQHAEEVDTNVLLSERTLMLHYSWVANGHLQGRLVSPYFDDRHKTTSSDDWHMENAKSIALYEVVMALGTSRNTGNSFKLCPMIVPNVHCLDSVVFQKSSAILFEAK